MQDPAVVDKVLATLKELAGTMGATAEAMWPMAVKAVFAQGVATLISGIFVAVISIIAFVFAWRFNKSGYCDRYIAQPLACTIMGLAVIAFITSGIVVCQHGLVNILAPEGQTIRMLLNR